MPTKIFYQRHREELLQKQRDFYESNKQMLKEQARIKYHSLSSEEKVKKSKYAKKWCNNLSDDKKNYKKRLCKKQISQYD